MFKITTMIIEYIVVFAVVALFAGKGVKNAMRSDRKNGSYPGKIPSQTNELSRRIAKQERQMEEREEQHEEYYCKYTTEDPNFSFEGLPNDYDDFAALRKRNAEHEKHLQKRIF